jgi:hypothetical protein
MKRKKPTEASVGSRASHQGSEAPKLVSGVFIEHDGKECNRKYGRYAYYCLFIYTLISVTYG